MLSILDLSWKAGFWGRAGSLPVRLVPSLLAAPPSNITTSVDDKFGPYSTSPAPVLTPPVPT
jgi:hypothetical protein